MKSKVRLGYKLFHIILLFCYGLMIAGAVFPALDLMYSVTSAKNKRDKLKTHWLKIFATILNLQVIQEGELPETGTLLVSNHISWLDIVAIGKFLPAYFVAKSDILSWPVIGYLSRQGGTIFIRRGDKKHIMETTEMMVWALKQNSNIIAFPEGTTTSGDEVLSFHASLFQSALLTKSAIQPVAIQYKGAAREHAPFIGDDEFIPHLFRMLSLDKIEVRVCFMPVIKSSGRHRHSVGAEARELILLELFRDTPVSLDAQAVDSHRTSNFGT